jgi:hypothetical protein
MCEIMFNIRQMLERIDKLGFYVRSRSVSGFPVAGLIVKDEAGCNCDTRVIAILVVTDFALRYD